MRKVLFKKWIPLEYLRDENGEVRTTERGEYLPDPNTKCWSDYIHEGIFHQWANAYEEFETGAGNYTVALIEIEDGTIVEILPTNVKFLKE